MNKKKRYNVTITGDEHGCLIIKLWPGDYGFDTVMDQMLAEDEQALDGETNMATVEIADPRFGRAKDARREPELRIHVSRRGQRRTGPKEGQWKMVRV
jgi:hypothetical protein